VRQVSVNNVWLPVSEPPREAKPAAWVGNSLAHFQVQEADSRRAKLRCGSAGGASESDYGGGPTTAMQSFSQQDGLALGAADTVEPGNDEGRAHQDCLLGSPLALLRCLLALLLSQAASSKASYAAIADSDAN
jgi:hypothetical protein